MGRDSKGSAIFTLAETGVSEHRRVSTFDATGEVIDIGPLDPPNRNDPFDVQP